jgi:hypothetical protein
MNPYLNIALIVWTLLLSLSAFINAASTPKLRFWFASMSFLSLFTALLAIGQYIN